MKRLIYCLVSILFVVNFASAQDLPDGLVAYYPFDGDANNQAADMGHGTVVGAVLTEDRNGNPNSAYLFSGESGEYIEVSDYNLILPMGDEPRTLAAWVRCDDLTLEDAHIIAYGTQTDGQHCHLSMHVYDGFIRMGFWYNDIDAYVGLFDPVWYHIAGVWDGNEVRIYFDGELQENVSPASPVNTVDHETIRLRIGCQNSSSFDNQFAGAIDEVMIFSRALDDNEIASIMDFTSTQIGDENNLQISSFKLYQNYPNPFNPSTKIDYYLPKSSFVSIKIYDMMGIEIKNLMEEEQLEGIHSVIWNGTNQENKKVASSIYFYKLETKDFKSIRKMVLLK